MIYLLLALFAVTALAGLAIPVIATMIAFDHCRDDGHPGVVGHCLECGWHTQPVRTRAAYRLLHDHLETMQHACGVLDGEL